jgi:ABC-2 type transport system ATP-binding protein
MTPAIEIKNVAKAFGDNQAVKDLSFTIPRGALYGFIGPNGAGKTTTLRMILSILFQDSGEIAVLGNQSALDAKDRIGYLPEDRGLYKKMRVGACLRYMGKLKSRTPSRIDADVGHWLARVDLPDVEKKRCEELSKGMQQKVQFIAAVMHEPDLLILDEPFSGLDPINRRLLRELIAEQHDRGATVIFSTHVMVHAKEICDHIIMIDRGTKVLGETLSGIRHRHDPRSIVFEALDAQADLSALEGVPGLEEVRKNGHSAELLLREGADVGETLSALAASVPASRLEVVRPTLEDVFIKIVGRERLAEQDKRDAPEGEGA